MARTFPLLRSLHLRRAPRPGRGAPEGRSWTGVQSLVALALLAIVSVVVGILLGASADRLEMLGGLLLMVPAAIALQGKIFGALGSRLGTAIHAGTFRLSLRPATVVGENIVAGLALSIVTSAVLAMLAKATASLFNIAESMSLEAFVVISTLGGAVSSLFVLIVALGMAAGSARFGWDPDNVTAPLVTAAADVITLPVLLLVVPLASSASAAGAVAIVCGAAAAVTAVSVWRMGRPSLRGILRESFGVLVVALLFDLAAGVIVEQQEAFLGALPSLLVLLPGYLAVGGALGGILSSRLASKLHLGLIEPAALPGRDARREIRNTFLLGLPVLAGTAALAFGAAELADLAGPRAGGLIGAALVGGVVAVAVASFVAYYGTILAERVGADPDTYGIPLVSSAMDLVGALTLVAALAALGIL
jgi:mgtE-like transporter